MVAEQAQEEPTPELQGCRCMIITLVIVGALIGAMLIVALHPVARWQLRKARVLSEHSDGVISVAWSPDGTRLASGSWDHSVILWAIHPAGNGSDAATSERLRTLSGNEYSVESVAWSPDGTKLASAALGVFVWDTETGEQLHTLRGQGPSFVANTVVWSPDGTTLALASPGHDRPDLWDVTTGEEVHTLSSQSAFGAHGESMAWSPDGSRLAYGGDGVILWAIHPADDNAASGNPLHTLKVHEYDWVRSVAWSPDGTMLAAGTSDHSVIVWDSQTGERLLTLDEHTLPVVSVTWSPDGTMLASGSYDRRVIVWAIDPAGDDGAASGERLRTMRHLGGVLGVAWSPDGKTLAVGVDTESKNLVLWNAPE